MAGGRVAFDSVAPGGVHKLALQATRVGWLDEVAQDLLLAGWQLVQSLVVTVLAVLAYLLARKADKTFREVEDLAGYLADRLRPTLRKGTKLTSREQEVLALIGEGALTDAELGERLHVAPATAKTHVRTLLRKLDVHRRQDLVVVAFLLRASSSSSDPPRRG